MWDRWKVGLAQDLCSNPSHRRQTSHRGSLSVAPMPSDLDCVPTRPRVWTAPPPPIPQSHPSSFPKVCPLLLYLGEGWEGGGEDIHFTHTRSRRQPGCEPYTGIPALLQQALECHQVCPPWSWKGFRALAHLGGEDLVDTRQPAPTLVLPLTLVSSRPVLSGLQPLRQPLPFPWLICPLLQARQP